METEEHAGCVQPAGGPVRVPSRQTAATAEQEGTMIAQARVGHEAPDFEATAFVDGGFRNVKLSDYRGRWVTLCFYPGDFTFV